MTGRAEALRTLAADPVLDMASLAITSEASQAHWRVIATGLQHIDQTDSCADKGIPGSAVEHCPYYTEADLAYTALIHQGQKSATH